MQTIDQLPTTPAAFLAGLRELLNEQGDTVTSLHQFSYRLSNWLDRRPLGAKLRRYFGKGCANTGTGFLVAAALVGDAGLWDCWEFGGCEYPDREHQAAGAAMLAEHPEYAADPLFRATFDTRHAYGVPAHVFTLLN